jgi:hypothetical protein
MQIKTLMMVLIVAGILALCAGGALYSLNSQYNTEPVNISIIDDAGDDINTITTTANDSYNLVSGGDQISAGGVTGVIFNGIGNFFVLVAKTITTPIKWIFNMAIMFGIPAAIVYAVSALLIIGITFAILSAILRRTP